MAVMYSAAILAGGKSSRMGRDKALLTLNGERFIDILAREFSACGDVFVSAAHPGDYADAGLPVIADAHPEIGPIEGIRQALLHAREDWVFVCATDMPFLQKAAADYLAEFISSDCDACVFAEGGRLHPLCALYHKSVLPVVEGLIRQRRYRLSDILSSVRTKYVRLETSCFDGRILRNINTPGEYRAALGPAVFCVSGVKNSGKTTLIEKLIPCFTADGLNVGVIKHDGHDFTCDVEGTDSHRLYRAGAKSVAVFSAEQTFLHERRQVPMETLIDRMAKMDFVIVEGLKASPYPKVEVVRGEVSQRPVCAPETLMCVCSDTVMRSQVPCPVVPLDDAGGVYTCIRGFFERDR